MIDDEQTEILKSHQGERRICCFNGLPAPGMRRYHYDMTNPACPPGHPQMVIRARYPDAHNFEPQSMFDCWLFDAPEIAELPPYIQMHGRKR
jgi:hypothetical protein